MHQTSPHWHALVIVEDAERASFEDLLRNVLGDPRVDLIVNQGRGLGGALNTGMRRARTEFVTVLMADDVGAGTPRRLQQVDGFSHVHRRVEPRIATGAGDACLGGEMEHALGRGLAYRPRDRCAVAHVGLHQDCAGTQRRRQVLAAAPVSGHRSP